MNILIISGFLGSGKTSFIKAMTKATKRPFVVVENEFGELNLDAPMLQNAAPAPLSAEEAAQKMEVWELTEGCICCSMNMDFSQSVLTIANTLAPDYLLVEPSGVAKPGRILENLRKIQYDRIRLLKPVTIIDTQNYPRFRQEFPEYFRDQLQNSGTLVLSKSENLSHDDFLQIRDDLGHDLAADFPLEHYENWSKADWMRLLRDYDGQASIFDPAHLHTGEAEHHHHEHGHEMGDMESMAFRDFSCVNPDELICKLNILVSGVVGELYRAKGYFPCGKEYLHFDLVGREYSINACPAMPDSRLVVIGRKLNREALSVLFSARGMSEAESRNSREDLLPDFDMEHPDLY